MALELPEDELYAAMVTAARLLARATIFALPPLGKAAMQRQLNRRGGKLVLVLDLGAGTGEAIAMADGQAPMRAPLRR